MPYGTFKTVLEVTEKFGLEEADATNFISTLKFEVLEMDITRLKKRLSEKASFVSEEAVCERIISRILELLDDHYTDFLVWSHIAYNVDEKNDLAGRPDFLVAPKTKQGRMDVPPLCIVEAKRQDWEQGWAQALAEMYAASTQGANICYAVVTSGKAWEFGKLNNGVFTKDPNQISATDNLQKVFDTLNWLFNEVDKTIKSKEK